VFSVFRRVERRFSQNSNGFLRVASKVIKETAVPIFLDEVPVSDDSAFDWVDNFLSPCQLLGLVTDGEIEGLGNFPVAHCPASF
jgi:hypothetical protein